VVGGEKVAVLVPKKPSSWTRALHNALEVTFSADVYHLGPAQPLPNLSAYSLVISRLKFRHLAAYERLDWGDCTGMKVHWDEDGFWDALWTDPIHHGLWSKNFPRLGFDLLVVTGARARDYFLQRGIPTEIVHKGFDPGTFHAADVPRKNVIAMYGEHYTSRLLAARGLERAHIPVEHFKVPFTQLAPVLNTYLSSLICTLDVQIRGGTLGRRLSQRVPSLVRGTLPGPEPMLKLFEAAAVGCAPYTDYSPDLEGLGFIDGVTAIIFRDIPELVVKAQHYRDRPEEVRDIGARAAELVANKHTWQHRADALKEILGGISGSSHA